MVGVVSVSVLLSVVVLFVLVVLLVGVVPNGVAELVSGGVGTRDGVSIVLCSGLCVLGVGEVGVVVCVGWGLRCRVALASVCFFFGCVYVVAHVVRGAICGVACFCVGVGVLVVARVRVGGIVDAVRGGVVAGVIVGGGGMHCVSGLLCVSVRLALVLALGLLVAVLSVLVSFASGWFGLWLCW